MYSTFIDRVRSITVSFCNSRGISISHVPKLPHAASHTRQISSFLSDFVISMKFRFSTLTNGNTLFAHRTNIQNSVTFCDYYGISIFHFRELPHRVHALSGYARFRPILQFLWNFNFPRSQTVPSCSHTEQTSYVASSSLQTANDFQNGRNRRKSVGH